MATKRQREGGGWEYVIRRKGLLPKPIYLTFQSEDEGDSYCRRLESILDSGIVPPELIRESKSTEKLHDLIDDYLSSVSVPESDRLVLGVVQKELWKYSISQIDYPWCHDFVTRLKRVSNLSPSTIRHKVGALARCLDWAGKTRPVLAANPLRTLPKRYATYTDMDREILGSAGKESKADKERDRRIEGDEEERIRSILDGEKPKDKQRPLTLERQVDLIAFFTLALETGMRMSEMYTLNVYQVDIKKRTIFLEKTKNGNKRQVALTSVAVETISKLISGRDKSEILFPWWDGQEISRRKTTSLLSRQFTRIFTNAGCADLNFHDLRHEYTCRLYEKTTMTDVEVAKQLGWKSLKMALRYGNLRGATQAGKLW